MILSRIHPVEEAVAARPREIEWVLFDQDRRDHRFARLKALCRERGVMIRQGPRRALDQLGGPGHQGVVGPAARPQPLTSDWSLASVKSGLAA